jgi:hypothetical protein
MLLEEGIDDARLNWLTEDLMVFEGRIDTFKNA